MLSRHRILLIFLAPVLLCPALASAGSVDALLRQLRQAHGAAPASGHAALLAEGQLQANGFQGPWRSAVDLRNGHFAEHTRNSMLTGADGYDERGRWHQDDSGMVHPYDSHEAKAVAAVENWLRRFGYLDANDPAHYRALPDADEAGHRFQRLEAMPAGGRAVTLWIDPATHRLDHATWQSAFLSVSRQYGDYREVGGLWLPFRMHDLSVTAGGGVDMDRTVTVQRYRWMERMPAGRLARPDGKVRDVTMAAGARRATASLHLEGGFMLVDVSVDGHGPLPFILDTGGHAILTTDAARKLGLSTQGQGTSTGSGPGAMSTAYTKVAHLGIGQADTRDLSFLVMPLPMQMCERGEGREPIAGILGLEIFERFAVTFDYDHHQLVLEPYDHGDAPPAVSGNALPLSFTFDMPLVEARLDGHAGVFGIDSGNSGLTLLFPQWAVRNGIAGRYEHGAPIPTGGVGGRYLAHFAHARGLQLGGVQADGLLAMLTRADAGATGSPSEAGNIGQDVLSRFNVHFDYRRGEMVLMPRVPAMERTYAMAGFVASKSARQPDRYRISWVIPGSPAAEAGLKKDDEIAMVNGKPARAIGFGELRAMSRWQHDGAAITLELAGGRRVSLHMRDVAP